MDWTQTIALGGTLIAYITGLCIFFYHLNEKNIREWREEHKSQIEKNEGQWRDLFMYFNNRLDEKKK